MAEKKRAKRGNAEGSVYETVQKRKRSDGTIVERTVYRGYVTVEIVGTDQKRKYVSANTRAGALAKIRKLLNDRDAGTLSHTASPTVEQWIDHYLTELAPKKGRNGLTRSTISSYKSWARNHVLPRIGKVKLEALKVEHLEAVYQAMADAGLSSSSIKSCHTMLSSSLDIAWKRGRLPRNVATLAMLPSGTEPAEVREVTVEEMKSVLVRANQRRMAARWVVRLAYGIRQGECLGLSWADVDFDAGVLYIRQQLQRDRAEHGCGEQSGTVRSNVQIRHGCGKSTGKTTVGSHGEKIPARSVFPCGKRRAGQCPQVIRTGGLIQIPVYPCGKKQPAKCPQAIGGGMVIVATKTRASKAPLPLPAPIAELLRARKTEQKRERIQEGPRWTGWEVNGQQADLVFTTRTGGPLGAQDDWSEWYELLAEAGVAGIKPHAARHWAATMLVALGVHPRTAMEMLRHADVSTTLNLYAKAPSADLRAAADALAEMLLGKAIGG